MINLDYLGSFYTPRSDDLIGYFALNTILLIRDHLALPCIMKPSIEQSLWWLCCEGFRFRAKKGQNLVENGILVAEYHIILSKNHILPRRKLNCNYMQINYRGLPNKSICREKRKLSNAVRRDYVPLLVLFLYKNVH